MKVTEENFRMASNAGSTVAFADITFDGVITVKDVRLMEGKNGMFAAMPSRKDRDGKYHEIVRIADERLRDNVTELFGRKAENYGVQN